MKRDYKLFLNDIEESARLIQEYIKGISEKEFRKNSQIQDSVIRRIEIIGVAIKNIPKSVRNINKEFPWEEFSSFRNFISHSYFEASIQRIWKMCQERIPLVIEEIKKIKLL